MDAIQKASQTWGGKRNPGALNGKKKKKECRQMGWCESYMVYRPSSAAFARTIPSSLRWYGFEQFYHPCDGMGWGTRPLLKPAKASLHVQIVVIPPVGQVFSLPLLSMDLIFKLLSRTLLQMILDVRDLGSIFF